MAVVPGIPTIEINGDGTITLHGWNGWVRDLKRIDPLIAKEIRGKQRDIARMIKDAAIGNARDAREARVAQSLRVGASQGRATITLAPTKSVPFVLGTEFGAKQGLWRKQKAWWKRKTKLGGMRGWNQYKPWRGNQWKTPSPADMGGPIAGAGYLLYPAIREKSSAIVEAYADSVDFAIERSAAFPN